MFTACSVYPNLRHVRFCSLAFQKYSMFPRRELPYSIHTPANQTSRIEHGTHAFKPLQKVPKITVMWNMELYEAWCERLSNAQA
jgi:hypothetical protein